MGNWRTVSMTGSVAPEEEQALRDAATVDWNRPSSEGDQDWGPLCIYASGPSLCGLNDWVGVSIARNGNLSERDFDPKDVAEHLERLAKAAPSLSVDVHCGGDWESEECVATVKLRDGKAEVGPPERSHVSGATTADVQANLAAALMRPSR